MSASPSGGARRGAVVIAMPVLLGGGTEAQTLQLAAALIADGRPVTVLCYHERDEETVGRFAAAGATVVPLDLPRADGLRRVYAAVRAFLAAAPPAMVHVQYLAPGLVPVLAARSAGVPRVVATVHQSGRPYGARERFLLRRAAGLCAAFTCVSRSVERSWFGSDAVLEPGAEQLPGRHCTIYNAVDADLIAAQARGTDGEAVRSGLGLGGRRVVGVVGRLREERGQAAAIDALAVIRRDAPDVALLLVGDGPDRQALAERARAAGQGDAIRFTGAVSPDEVACLHAALDVALVPSLTEGFGLAAAEAMAAGVPLVASDVDGLPELVGDAGILVPPGDVAAIVSATRHLLARPGEAERFVRRGSERVRRLFSVAVFRERIRALYGIVEGGS